MKNNIVLVGFMGCGKTTVGKLLAPQLAYSFIDTDQLIENNEKTDIPAIFDSKGEAYFRQAETKALKQVMDKSKLVVATGGGIVTIPENKTILQQGTVIYLEASPGQIYQHVKDDESRPLLKGNDVYGKICEMLKQRQALYQQVAHHTIQVDHQTPQEICKLIINVIK